MIIQFCGLSVSGKTTLARELGRQLREKDIDVEIIDGDEYRQSLCADLGFSKEDRNENIRRLAFVAGRLAAHGIVPVICAINPYEDVRREVTERYPNVKTVFISCDLETLAGRDTKGLYARAQLLAGHPERMENLSGVNDPFESPEAPDLVIDTSVESIAKSVTKLLSFVLKEIDIESTQHNSSASEVGIGVDQNASRH